MASEERRKSGWRGKAGLALFGALFALLICEVGARWLYHREYQKEARLFDSVDMMAIRRPDKEYEFSMKPDHSGSNVLSGWTWHLTTNSRGFRGREIDPEKPADTFRILFLGDSTTFGVGVEDDEVFTERVEAKLNDASAPLKVQSVNLGVPGYNTHQERALLKEQIDIWDPDAVALTFGANDAEPQFTVPPHPRHSLRNVRFWFLERTRVTLNDLFHESDEHYPLGQLRYNIDWIAGFDEGNPKRRIARTAFARLVELCHDRDVPLLTLYVNTCDPTLLDDGYRAIRNTFSDWARDEGIPHDDLFDRQAAHDYRKIWTNGDAHPNALGHEIIADGWIEALKPLLEKREPGK